MYWWNSLKFHVNDFNAILSMLTNDDLLSIFGTKRLNK